MSDPLAANAFVLCAKDLGFMLYKQTLDDYPSCTFAHGGPLQGGARYREAGILRSVAQVLVEQCGCNVGDVMLMAREVYGGRYAVEANAEPAGNSNAAGHAPGPAERAAAASQAGNTEESRDERDCLAVTMLPPLHSHLAQRQVAAEMVLSIQELCDHIADHIALQPSAFDDLKSAALVCQTLCISAQSHLFRHILLAPSRRRGESIASPRLSRHVHHLTILARPEILKPILDARFPCLRKLSFIFVYPKWPADQSGLIRDCISLPSIREVELTDCGDCLTDLHFVASFFDNPSPQLHSLIFSYIHHLQLYGDTDLGPWVASPSSPFDFTHLVEFETDRYYDSTLQILASARLSLTRLRIPGDCVNFPDLPALTCLEFTEFERHSLSSLSPDKSWRDLLYTSSSPESFEQLAIYNLASSNDNLFDGLAEISDIMMSLEQLFMRSSCALHSLFLRRAAGDAGALPRCLRNLERLTKPSVDHANLQDDKAPALMAVLSELISSSSSIPPVCPNLTHLRIIHCNIT
ncbi:hypothetical protein FB451DRAFT_1391371 [Mycena latifolia]|nr:hypothetical protein FB451DRAFT_1391371 [Mycena latifolia]